MKKVKYLLLIVMICLLSGCNSSNKDIIGETKYGINNVEVFCDKENNVEYLIISSEYIIPRYKKDGTLTACGGQ